MCLSVQALKKVSGNLTASMLGNYEEDDQGYTFINHVKGTPVFWKRFLWEVLAMIRQLGCPSFFLTLLCADLYWEELIFLISELNNLGLSKSDARAMSYLQRCEILNNDLVFISRYYQYSDSSSCYYLLKFCYYLLLPGGPLGDVIHYAIRVEFHSEGHHTYINLFGL